ncbi:hypothetical protein AQ948_29370 [Burkholderia pseudomallei]|nr:hypothetical protein AQ948_29370 [Burkholderia pseudomallei]
MVVAGFIVRALRDLARRRPAARDGAARDAAVRRRRGPDTDARSRRERSRAQAGRPGGAFGWRAAGSPVSFD